MNTRRSRSLRWLAPLAVAAAIVTIATGTGLSAAATPDLKSLTPQELILKVRSAKVTKLSGTVKLTADLGIPNLSALQGGGENAPAGFTPLTLLSGSHTADVSYDGVDRQRVALLGSLSETDVYRDGTNLWLWDSVASKATHYLLPAEKGGAAAEPATEPAVAKPVPTPAELANKLLDRITPSTKITVTTPAYVADQPVYELVLAPRTAASTVDHVAIAVDANTGLPLKVTIVAKGQSAPAVQLGFSRISYTAAPGPFGFTPPSGATVTTHNWTTSSTADHVATHEPTSATTPTAEPVASRSTRTVGTDWSQVVIAAGLTIPRSAHEVLHAATRVSGSWGSGSLLQTKLVNVLILDDGRVASGLVTPSAIEAALSSP